MAKVKIFGSLNSALAQATVTLEEAVDKVEKVGRGYRLLALQAAAAVNTDHGAKKPVLSKAQVHSLEHPMVLGEESAWISKEALDALEFWMGTLEIEA